jgi:hypothetical protein
MLDIAANAAAVGSPLATSSYLYVCTLKKGGLHKFSREGITKVPAAAR